MSGGPRAALGRRWLLVSLLGLGLVVANTWPLAPSLNRIGRVDSFDGMYGLWQATWVARALVTDPLHLYDANIFFPHRSTLAFSEPSLLAGMLGLPAYFATESPYVSVTDNSGSFKLSDVPAGTYNVEVWHEKLGKTSQKVTVKGKEDAKVNFEMAGK